jgi:tRNA nucleotidyltransferase (CCA-adding enzyme)
MMSHHATPGVRHNLPKDLQKYLQPLIQRAQKTQLPIYLVGGCVRDLLLGHVSLDIDIVVEELAAPLAKSAAALYKAKLVSHPQFFTHTLQLPDGRHIDIATARKEKYPEQAALPVVETASLQEDLYRRDFSINAIAISLNANDFGHIWDPFGGTNDLTQKRIRVLHSESFNDDPTRIFRAARFAGRFGYDLDWRTREWMLQCIASQTPSRLSGARLREELIPLLMEKDPRPAFRLLGEWGALGFLVPNLKWEKSHDALFGHFIKAKLKGDPLLLRLLILMHALPFPKAVGSLGHLMFPQKAIEQVEQALLLFVRLRQGVLELADAKRAASKPLSPEVVTFLSEAVRLKAMFPRKQPVQEWRRFQDSNPCLSGQDIRALGYKPGPVFTKIIDALRQARWEGKLRTREEEIRFLTHTFPLNGN